MRKNKFNPHNEHEHEHESQDILADETTKRGITKSVITVLLIVFLLASWWYGFGKSYAAIKSVVVSAKSGIASVFHISKANTADEASNEKLSTDGSAADSSTSGFTSSSSWEIRKSMAGDTIWKMYAQNLQAQSDVAFQHQVINGLKNITVLKNNIAQEKLAHNSMTQGQEYSFLTKDMQEKFAGKVAEANKQLKEGKSLKDMDNSLSLAYQLANPPSYSFVYSLSVGDVQNLLE